MAERSVGASIAHGVAAGSRWTGRQIRGEVVKRVGGAARARVIVLFGLVLALNGADAATIGAVAPELQKSLGISIAEIGLLSSVTLLVGAVATIPAGLLVDRTKRIPMLSVSIILWSMASLLSAFAGSFSTLLLTRLLLGAVVATAGPAIASLTGDYFPARERGRIYAYILGGEIAGNAVGFIICGNVASAIGWQSAFVLLAIPGFFLARELYRTVPEPLRGGQSHLEPGAEDLVEAAAHARARAREGSDWLEDEEQMPERDDLAQEAARRMGLEPDPKLVLTQDPRELSITESVRYTLSIPSNVMMIISSSLGYFFFSGLTTFALVFVRGHYGVGSLESDLVLALMVVGALIGTLVSGWLGDLLLRRGHLTSRVWLPAVCYLAAAVLLIPGFISSHLTPALWFDVAGAALIAAANPPLNAARLDIMPAGLWGRAESVRTVVRSLAQAIAPLLFGGLASVIAGFYPRQALPGTHPPAAESIRDAHGLEITFLLLLVTLAAAGIVLLRGRHYYPRDVATAGASNQGSSEPPERPRPTSGELTRTDDSGARQSRRERRAERRGSRHRWD
jgi:MFS family permease